MQKNQQMIPVRSEAPEQRWLEPQGYDYPGAGSANEQTRLSTLLRRYRLAIGAIFGVCLLVSLAYVKLAPVTYQSKILLEVMAPNNDFLNLKAVDPNTSIATPDNYVETQAKLLTTDEVIERTARAVGPSVPASVLNHHSLLTRLKSLFGQDTPDQKITGEEIVEGMLRKAKVKPEGTASLISVTLTGPDAELTARTANTLADQFIQQVQEARWKAAARTGEFLATQIDGMRQKLQKSEDAMQAYAKQVGLIYTDANHESVAADRLRQVQSDLARAEADLSDKQSQIELVKGASVDALPKVFDDPSLRDLKSRLADLRRQEADLSASFTPEHYKVKHVKSQIAELQAQVEIERKTILNRIQLDYAAAKRREQLLNETYQKQLGTLSDQSLAQVKYNMLQREVEANRDVYQSMLQRVKEASVASALHASNIRTANPAKPSFRPYSPDIVIDLGLGLLSATMFSVLFVLLRERTNRSIRMPGETIRVIAVPELGVIPSAKGGQAEELNGRKKMLRLTGGSTEAPAVPSAITTWDKNEPIVKESIRSVVTSLLMYGESFYRNRIILVTSPHPQAGKTTAVANLGLALAESGRRVLIIDGDLRRPRLSSIFGVQDEIGLADVLRPDAASALLDQAIQRTLIENLSILPSGDASADLHRLLHSPRLEEVLSGVREKFDFILVDSPPMMALTDARLLSRNTDGVILVCRAGRTTSEQLAFSYRRLAEDGTEVIGTILNDWNPKHEDPTYFNSYSEYARSSRS